MEYLLNPKDCKLLLIRTKQQFMVLQASKMGTKQTHLNLRTRAIWVLLNRNLARATTMYLCRFQACQVNFQVTSQETSLSLTRVSTAPFLPNCLLNHNYRFRLGNSRIISLLMDTTLRWINDYNNILIFKTLLLITFSIIVIYKF
jgi:hypothetical protein